LIHRTTSAALVALLPIFVAGCTIDFDNYLSTGGGGVGGQGGGTTTTTTGGGGQGTGGTGGTGGGGCVPADCDDGNLCTTDTCNNGVCQYEAAGDPDLSSVDVADDCRDPVCVGTMLEVAGGADDDTEIPADDGVECTQNTCQGGVPYPPEPSTVSCATGKCNGNGACVSCIDAGDCGALGACIASFACTNNACVPTYKPDTTKVSDDGTNGNCKATFCDGNGGMMTGNDDSDTPAPSVCHKNACNAGVPDTGNVTDGTGCDDGGAEAGGQCKTGSCVDCTTSTGCSAGHTCLGTNMCCSPMDIPTACAAAGKVCGMVSNGCGGMVTCPGCGSSPDGTDCVSSNSACGCNMDNDCDPATQWGDACVSGKCGCNDSGDCDTAKPDCETTSHKCVECSAPATCAANVKGEACLPTFVCGCQTNTDCMNVGAAHTCNMGTGVCNP